MRIDTILAGIRESTNTKTAAATEKTAAPVAPANTDALTAAMQDAVTAASSTKTASEVAPSPVADVMKIAEEVAAAEREAMQKEAQVLGALWADAAITRLNAWRDAAVKTASVSPVAAAPGMDPEVAKIAQENPELVKEAEARGYALNRVGLEKLANESFVEGYNDTVEQIHKLASVEFLKGAAVVSQVIDAQGK